MSEIILGLKAIKKSFEDTEVLKGISLSIERGEFITFLGASGCGKTTTLRIIAGLESPDAGRVYLNGKDVTDLEPNKRNVNTVFQNYALFPHMDVFSNVAYGLRLRKVPKRKIAERVREMLEMVQLSGYEKRMPSELSGGQRQRVAIARAVVNDPQVLLLDEPLGALDLQLRRQMQVELKRIQKRLGITFLYITHDQEEALNMSDRIVVMKDGRFEQIGTPDQVYYHPKTSYVARFVGTANIITGKLLKVEDGVAEILVETERTQSMSAVPERTQSMSVVPERTQSVSVETAGAQSMSAAPERTQSVAPERRGAERKGPEDGMESENEKAADLRGAVPGGHAGGRVLATVTKEQLPYLSAGQPVTVAVRSENVLLSQEPGEGLKLSVIEKNFAGGMLRISLDGGDLGELTASRQGIDASFQPGDVVFASWQAEHGVIVDLDKGP